MRQHLIFTWLRAYISVFFLNGKNNVIFFTAESFNHWLLCLECHDSYQIISLAENRSNSSIHDPFKVYNLKKTTTNLRLHTKLLWSGLTSSGMCVIFFLLFIFRGGVIVNYHNVCFDVRRPVKWEYRNILSIYEIHIAIQKNYKKVYSQYQWKQVVTFFYLSKADLQIISLQEMNVIAFHLNLKNSKLSIFL